jgi:hypothetical protein
LIFSGEKKDKQKDFYHDLFTYIIITDLTKDKLPKNCCPKNYFVPSRIETIKILIFFCFIVVDIAFTIRFCIAADAGSDVFCVLSNGNDGLTMTLHSFSMLLKHFVQQIFAVEADSIFKSNNSTKQSLYELYGI